tara:strand:+ start:2031 stop:2969 length:939 start_codon:yes stop_codon:yes gene_type:complete
MGILRTDPYTYYDNTSPDFGRYQFISLTEIIDSFSATYVGKDKICDNVTLNDITFHAIRGLQELSYDTLKCTKSWEVEIPSSLVLVMPIDYVNYVGLYWADDSGALRRIYPTSKTANPFDVSQTVQGFGGFDTGGASQDLTRTAADSDGNFGSTTFENYKSNTTSDIGDQDADEIDDQYGELLGGRYGLDPQYAQANGTFFIDEEQGKFHFSSSLSGKTLVLKYISDGIASNAAGTALDLSNSLVPKFAEEAIYQHILYGVLFAKKDTNQGLLSEIKRRRFAETRKAKIRLSNYKLEELTQVLRGSSKIIKH